MSDTESNQTENEQMEAQKKLEKVILDLNKAGLFNLTQMNFEEAIEMFKKAEKIIQKEGRTNQLSNKMNQLSGITFNNLACYYKKTKKPKVALKYLKKALELEVFKLNNWTSIAGTHLNICAIYSLTNYSHEEASNHAELAINFLDKVEYQENDTSEDAKSYWNVLMLSYYNLAIEKEYLKDYRNSIKCYLKAKEIAQLSPKKNFGIVTSCDEGILRVRPILKAIQRKTVESLKKKQLADEKGFNEYIRMNKRHFSVKRQNEEQVEEYMSKLSKYDDVGFSNKFRSKRIASKNVLKDGLNSTYHRKDGWYSTFHNRTLSSGKSIGRQSAQLLPKHKKPRLITENSQNFQYPKINQRRISDREENQEY